MRILIPDAQYPGLPDIEAQALPDAEFFVHRARDPLQIPDSSWARADGVLLWQDMPIDRAVADEERGLGHTKVRLTPEARQHLATISDGDARKCLTALELAALSTKTDDDGFITIDLTVAEESAQRKAIVYDGDGDAHYDTISAFIKSMRASDPDAALYWLAKMLYAGEDLRFIARRIVIAASEDVGMADSNALRVAIAAQQAVEFIGMPEARIPLAHATVYIATAPKSNSATLALSAAHAALKTAPVQPVPLPLRDKSGAASKQNAHGKGYLYSHDFPENISGQNYLEKPLALYTPKTAGWEAKIADRLARWQELKIQRAP